MAEPAYVPTRPYALHTLANPTHPAARDHNPQRPRPARRRV